MEKPEIDLKQKSAIIRQKVIEIIKKSGTGHTGSDLSCTDILVSLYYHVMKVDPNSSDDPSRDRYIQSKGHAAEVLWAVLTDRGFITEEEFQTFSSFGSRLIGHPNNKVPGIEMNTGSLGHGLSIAVGIALAAKMDQSTYHTYTLMGDGELAEGSVWEGMMAASQYKLDNLTAIIDRNGLQITGKTNDVMNVEPLKEKIESFGWQVIEVNDGNNIQDLIQAFENPGIKGKPKMIIAHTVKGRGISFAENKANWHHKVPTDFEYEQAMSELKKQMEASHDEA